MLCLQGRILPIYHSKKELQTLGRSLGRGFKVTPTEEVAQQAYNFCFDYVVNPKFLNKFCDYHDI